MPGHSIAFQKLYREEELALSDSGLSSQTNGSQSYPVVLPYTEKGFYVLVWGFLFYGTGA